MSTKQLLLRMSTLLLLLGVVASVPAFAGSAVIGSVAGSLNATVGGQALLPNTVVFSGDSLQVKDGAAVVAMENGSRMAFGRDTVASFLRDTGNVTVLLSQGNVSIYHPAGPAGLQVRVGNLSVQPAAGFQTLGDVAMLNGTVIVTAKQGSLHVDGNGSAVEVAQGKTMTFSTKTARAPQAGGSQKLGGTDEWLDVGGIAAGAVAAILAGVAISRANDAKDAANAATTAANNATAAANKADADAVAATAAANNAASVANGVGCALNNLNQNVFGGPPDFPSPYTPPSGFSCP